MQLYFIYKYSTDKIQRRVTADLFLNFCDLPDTINSTTCLFEDEYILYSEINNQSDPQELQKNLDELTC